MTEQTTLSIQDGVSALLGTPKASETPAEEPKQATPEPEEPDTEEPGGAEPEEEDDAGDEEADAPSDDEPDAEPEYEVELDGEVRKVRHKELVDGWRRGQHYESKVERLRQKEAAVEQELAAATQQRTRYAEQLSALEQALSQEDPDLQQLKQSDPARYLILKDARGEALKKFQEERQKVAIEQQQHEMAAIRQRLETEKAKLYALLPSWRDPKKAAAEQKEITAYAKSLGFNDQELMGLTDSRAVIALRKAWLYDKGRSLKDKKKAEAPKTVPAGRPATKAETAGRDRDKAMARLKKTGSMDDAVRVLLARK